VDRSATSGETDVSDRVYLDHAATTPVRPEAVAAMEPYHTSVGYNPSSLHAEGRRARAAVDRARETVAQALGARPGEIVFTGSGTEADNIAIFGVARARRERGKHIVSTTIEHHAVLHALDVLREDGWDVTLIDVDERGLVAPDRFRSALRPDTVLATVMLANNEIGTIEPIAELAAIARDRGVVLHTDAVQAPGKLSIATGDLGVDLLSIAAHKFYGPKGVGVLYVRDGTPLAPFVVGGGQERGRRSGTENVAGIVGLAEALRLAVAERERYAAEIGSLRDRLEALLEPVPDSKINGAGAARLPNNLSVSFAGVEADALLIRLDLEGVAASAGSACASGSIQVSHVLEAIGLERRFARGTIRLSLGKGLGVDAVARVGELIPRLVEELRAAATV
jgi:cysteine desulfurase